MRRSWAGRRQQGLSLYPHQDEAGIALFSGNNVILATPTGSGKSVVAVAAHFAAMAQRRRTFYTAPIKALVSEKFFALCAAFGAENVGLLTGDAAVNSGAPVICCTAEVLANIALREGARADVGQVVMDEFTSTPSRSAGGRGRSRCSACPTRSSCSCRRRSATSRRSPRT
jgi:superfamily II RNA helicase